MKIILINPPAEHLVRTFAPDSITEEMGFYPPMGLLYVATYARNKLGRRFEIEILDAQVEQMDHAMVEKYLEEKRPDLVGITCMTFMVIDALEVARRAKKANPDTFVIMGGVHPTIYPEELAFQPVLDGIVVGEGESVFCELLDTLDRKGSLSGIQGFGYKQNNLVRVNPRADFIKDLDSLPFPDRNLLPFKKYYNLLGTGRETMTGLLTSRGCPHHCIFCTSLDGRMCRMRSPENVVDEIEICVDKGISDFNVIDDTFTISRKRVIAIADLIIQKGLKITMDVNARVDQVDQEMLDKLGRAGCNRIRFGVESGNPEVLKILRKGISLDQAREAFKMAKRSGIATFAYFMLGSPGESKEEVKESIQLAKELNPDFVQFLITTPFPASDLYEMGMEKGILDGDYWREFSRHPSRDFVPRWWTENFSPEELRKWQKRAHLSFYYRPGYIWSQMKKLKSFKEFGRKALAGLRLFFG
jgi:anaerobic magnesium-protoporphyrin IX monomethyl ester cyclase